MGDEPSFDGVPWTDAIASQFLKRKGYDVRPNLARLFATPLNEEDRRIRADYWDVWTDLYRDKFFKPQSDWCSAHGLDYMVHLCGEENMKELVALDGDYFKCQRYVGIPGVDAIWRQIWPGVIADYPKLASSAAHVEPVSDYALPVFPIGASSVFSPAGLALAAHNGRSSRCWPNTPTAPRIFCRLADPRHGLQSIIRLQADGSVTSRQTVPHWPLHAHCWNDNATSTSSTRTRCAPA